MKAPLLIPITLMVLATGAGCSTETVNDFSITDNGISSGEKNYTLYIDVNNMAFTRGDRDKENDIKNLYLSFYERGSGRPIFLRTVKAKKDNNDNFIAEYTTSPGYFPDMLIATANYDDENDVPLQNPLDKTIRNLEVDGFLTMCSARYYDSDKNDIYYTSLTERNFTENERVNVYLERVPAKVSVSLNDSYVPSGLKMMSGGEELRLELSLVGWGIIGTDLSSNLVKDIGNPSNYENLVKELSGETGWNDIGNKTLHWTHSVAWDKTEFPIDEENACSSHHSYSEISFPLTSVSGGNTDDTPSFTYCHETTRRSSVFNTPGSLPYIVFAATYKRENAVSPETFFRAGREIMFLDDYYEAMADLQNEIFFQHGQKIDAVTFQKITWPKHPEECPQNINKNYVAPQLKDDVYISEFYDINGASLEDVKEINKKLYESCGLLEMFKNGAAIFLVPLVHFADKQNTETGYYGLVRNHHYTLTINSIEGIGYGVADLDAIITDPGESPSYVINFMLQSTDWDAATEETVTLVPGE